MPSSFPFFPFPFFPLYTFALFFALATFSSNAAEQEKQHKKVVIPFDFVSKFDNGRYGQIVGDMLWKKLSRENRFVVPESMDDVRGYCESHNLKPSPETSLEKMRKIVVDDFDAQIAVWGSVERAPGEESEIYDLTVKCADFSAKPQPKIIHDVTARTKSVSEISHVYLKQMFDALCEREPAAPAAQNQLAESNWKKNPNLIVGDFQSGADGVPRGWQKVCGQQREPLGKLVLWTAEQDNPRNKLVRFTLDKNVAENEGLMYYSDLFPVEENAAYRFECRWRSNGPAVKVFIKCYDAEGSPYAKDDEKKSPGDAARAPEKKQLREVYRSQQNLSPGPVKTWTWTTHTEDFTPRHVKYSPKWGSVMLYAYIVPGQVEFDDVVVKQIIPASPGEQSKIRRHSRESAITIEEMKENERRSEEIKRRPAP